MLLSRTSSIRMKIEMLWKFFFFVFSQPRDSKQCLIDILLVYPISELKTLQMQKKLLCW